MMNEKILEAFSKALGAVKAAPLKAVTGVAAHKVAAVAVASTLALGGAGVGVGVHMANEKKEPVTEEATVSPKKDSSKKVATKSNTPASTETEAPVETAPASAANDTAAPTSTSTNDSNKTKTTNKTASEKTASSKKAPATEQTSSGKHPDEGKVGSPYIWRNGSHWFYGGGPYTLYKLPDGFVGIDSECESHMKQKEAQWRAEEEAARNQRDQAYQACFQKMAEKYPEFSNSYDSNDITDPNDRAEFDKARATLDVECISPNRFNRYDYINNRQDVGAFYVETDGNGGETGRTMRLMYGQ